MSMDSRIDARLSKMEAWMDDLTFSVQQLTSLVIPSRQRGDFVTPTDTNLEVDGGIEVIGSSSNIRAPIVAHETMPILQKVGDIQLRFLPRLLIFQILQDKSIMRSSFVLLTLGEVVTPIMEITNQATTPALEEIDEVVDPIIGV